MNNSATVINIASQARFVRDSSLFSITLILGGVCNVVRSFFIARVLGPQGFGTWRFISIFVEYLHFASLGTQPALHRTIPFLRGRGDFEELRRVLRTTCATIFFFTIIYSVAIFTWSFFVTDRSTARAMAAFSPVIIFLSWLRYAQDFSLTNGLYDLRRRLEAIDAILSMALCVIMVHFWGVYGAIAGVGISALIALLILVPHLWQYFAVTIDWRILGALIVTGLPVLADTVLMITMANADRILIAAMLSRETLGIYSVGAAGFSILGTVPSALGQMLFVKFAEMDGLNRSKEHISEVLDRATIVLSSAFAPILSVALAVFPVMVVCFLPEYAGGIDAGKILIAGMFFFGVSLPASKWCISTGHFETVLSIRAMVVTLEFGTIYFAIKNYAGLEVIALCVFLAFLIYNGAIIVLCSHVLGKPLQWGMLGATKSMIPFVSVSLGLVVQRYMYSAKVYEVGMPLIISSIVGLILSLAASVPFITWANRRTRIIHLLVSASSPRMDLAKLS